VHHTTGLSGQNSIAVTIAVFDHLKRSRDRSGERIGFFAPIDLCPSPLHGPSRFQILKDVFGLSDSAQSMHGISHARALELIEHDRVDDIIDEVVKGMSKSNSLLVCISNQVCQCLSILHFDRFLYEVRLAYTWILHRLTYFSLLISI
jgi:hypothetical protein